jgi:hypothetical protein
MTFFATSNMLTTLLNHGGTCLLLSAVPPHAMLAMAHSPFAALVGSLAYLTILPDAGMITEGNES